MLQPPSASSGSQELGRVLHLVLRVGEVRQPDFLAKRDRPVTVDRGHSDEQSLRACALAQGAQELHPRADVFEDVRKDGDVDGLGRFVADCICLHVRHPGVREALARELQHPPACVYSCDARTRALGDVVGQLALAAADVQHALASVDAVDEEVVILRKSMLRVHSSVVVDRAEVDSHVCVLVDLEQLAHRLLVVAL